MDSESESRVYALTLLGKKEKLCIPSFLLSYSGSGAGLSTFVPISLRSRFKYYPHFIDEGTTVWEVCNSPWFLQQDGRGEPDLNPDPSGCTVRIVADTSVFSFCVWIGGLCRSLMTSLSSSRKAK